MRHQKAFKILNAWEDARQALRVNKLDVAKGYLWFIVRRDVLNYPAYNRLGIVYAKQEKLRRATLFFKLAASIDESPSLAHNLGLIYYERQMYHKAKKAFSRAISYDSTSAARYIALAKTEERIGNHKEAIVNLSIACELDDSPKAALLLTKAKIAYRKGKPLSEEIKDALENNLLVWDFESVDEYQSSLDNVAILHEAISMHLQRLKKKNLGPMSSHTAELAVVFLHNIGACLILLDKNYSHTGFVVARSIVELYLRCSYALRFKSYRGYAEMEKASLMNRVSANTRFIRAYPGDPHSEYLLKINGNLNGRLQNLEQKYKNLKQGPSLSQISLALDGNEPGKHYAAYSQCYETGSEVTHGDIRAVQRAARLSGTNHAGIFADSHALAILLETIANDMGELLLKLPEVTSYMMKQYRKDLSKANRKSRSL